MTSKTLKGMALASAAAGLFAMNTTLVSTAYAADGAKIHCEGVNSCKGLSDCKSGKSDCKGLNSCKGQGFKELTSEACTKEQAEMKKKG